MVDPKKTAAKLAQELRTTFGEDLRSVVLYGSVARGEVVPGVSDVNVLVLLEDVGPSQLAAAANLVQDWIRKGNTPPRIYAMDEWKGMRDTFAIEMSDMQDAREVLDGADPVAEDSVEPADLRTHAESEMRQTLFNMRTRQLICANDPAELGRLLLAGLPSFAAYMRAALRLSGDRPGLDTEKVIESLAARIHTDPAPMRSCWRARKTMHGLNVSIRDPLLAQYNDFNYALIDYLDHLSTQIPRRLGAALRTTAG
jgi:predicted nucleotidyltransferase